MTSHTPEPESTSSCCGSVGPLAGKLAIVAALLAVVLSVLGYYHFQARMAELGEKTSELSQAKNELSAVQGQLAGLEQIAQTLRDLPQETHAMILDAQLGNVSSQLAAVAERVADESRRQKLLELSNQILSPGDAHTEAAGAEPSGPVDPLQRLQDGNMRFVTNKLGVKRLGQDRRTELLAGQHPFAVILGCSDSRVPPELLFDQGLGDLFVVRVAGNVLDPVAMGSIEYAVEHLGSPLLVVLGHERCGAVKATVDGGGHAHGNVESIARKIHLSVVAVREAQGDAQNIYEEVTDENIRAMVRELRSNPVVEHLVSDGKLTVVGAKYRLDSGKVDFFTEH